MNDVTALVKKGQDILCIQTVTKVCKTCGYRHECLRLKELRKVHDK